MLTGAQDQKELAGIIFKNGASVGNIDSNQASGTGFPSINGTSGPVFMNGTTDYVEFFVYHDFTALTGTALPDTRAGTTAQPYVYCSGSFLGN